MKRAGKRRLKCHFLLREELELELEQNFGLQCTLDKK